MKKTLLIILLSLLTIPMFAKWESQPYMYEVRLGYGPMQLLNTCPYLPSLYGIVDQLFSSDSVSELYNSYPDCMVRTTGSFSFEFGMNFLKWLTFSVGVGATGYYGEKYGNDLYLEGTDKIGGASLCILPQVRFNYFSRPWVRLYSAVGLGLSIGAFSGVDKNIYVQPAFQLTAFGVSFGKEFFGFAEFGFGSISSLARAGIGYNF